MQSNLEQAIKLHQSGQLDTAAHAYSVLLNKHDDNQVHYLLGLLYSQRKEFQLAIKHLEFSISANKNNADIFNALALCYQKTGKYKTAEFLIEKAIKLSPDTPAFCNRKSKILITANKVSEALSNSLHCIKSHPDFFPVYQTYSSISLKNLRPDNSLRIMKRAFRQMPDNPNVIFSLAEAFHNVGKPEKASQLFKVLATNNFKTLESLNNLANIEREYGDIKLAREYYNQATKHSDNKSKPIVTWNIGLLDLLEENFSEGWKNYEDRLNICDSSSKIDHSKTWHGEDLKNKTVCIIAEQGLGDQILFSCTFQIIIQSCIRVYIQCDDQLKACFNRSFPSAKIITDIDQHLLETCDFNIFAGSILQYLPPLTGRNKYLVSNSQALPADTDKKLKIGFSWRGGTNYKDIKKRSTHLREWQSLFSNKECQFYCLQHNLSGAEKYHLKMLSPNIIILPTISKKNNVNELINVCDSMDLIISVTNTVTHIAGALGIKTWCLTPHNPDWPWGLKNESCLWYESVKLIRKQEQTWKSVFTRVENDLKELVKTENSTKPV